MKWKWVDAAVALAIGTGLLYACGYYYRQSYLGGFGLSAEQFQQSGEVLVLFGFHAGVLGGAQYLVWIVTLLYALFVGLLVWILMGRVAWFRVRWRAWRISRASGGTKSARSRQRFQATPAFRVADRIASVAPAFIVAFGALLLALVGAEALGKSQAGRAIDRFDGKARSVLWLDNGRSIRAGPVIVCDEEACAYLMSDGVLILRRDRVVSASVWKR